MKPRNTKTPADGSKQTSRQGRDILAPRGHGVEKVKTEKPGGCLSPMERLFEETLENHTQAIKETDDLLLARIYEDIYFTSMANRIKLPLARRAYCVHFQRASDLLDIALSHQKYSHLLCRPPHWNHEPVHRLANFAGKCGWHVFATCAFSSIFRKCATDSSEILWKVLEDSIYRNLASLELFAEMRGLNAENLLLEKGILDRPTPKNKAKEGIRDHPHHWVLHEDGTAIPPTFKGYLQENIDSNIFNPSDWKALGITRDPTLRAPGDGYCDLCGSPTLCDCAIRLPESTAFVELRKYEGKGIGVRALKPIQKGKIIDQFTGEIKPLDSREDSTFSLVQELTGPGGGKVLICPKRYGNWTRFINHSCDPSTKFERITVGLQTVMVVLTTRDIAPFEEITVSYGPGYLERMDCKCGTALCRSEIG